ncbi:MAG: ABC transporter permease [Candidatus Omnitrophica bacterium]|nr:ABC transporter permease [Candidatus Omnitrophota bacterium]
MSSIWIDAWKRLRRDRRAMAAMSFIIGVAFVAIFARWLAPYEPNVQVLDEAKNPPSLKHLLGTDKFGRDILSRLIYGAGVSFKVGFISQSISLFIGIILGSMAGYFRGWVDDVIMWLINVVWAFPTLLFVIAVSIALGPGITSVYTAVALVSWVGVARIVRGEFISIREREYVQAARALGASDFRIIFRHILPNTLAPIIVVVTLGFAGAIVAEAGLSFLGLGIQPPEPSWGSMLRTGYDFVVSAWWIPVFPGIAITFSVLAFNILGDGLRDALDPRLKGGF